MAVSSKRTEKWGRWVGSVDDVAAIASLTTAEVNRRRPADDPASCRIGLEIPGLDHEFGGPEEFAEEVRAPDVDRVKGLTVRVGSTWGSEPLAVAIAWTDFSGVTLTVSGTDRAVVVGAAQVLADRLNEGSSKRGVEPFLAAIAGWLAAAALSFVFGLVRFRTEEDTEPADPVVLAVLAGWFLIGFASYHLAKWCFPRIELLPAGQPSRWLRVRKFVLGALLFVAAAAAGVLADNVI